MTTGCNPKQNKNSQGGHMNKKQVYVLHTTRIACEAASTESLTPRCSGGAVNPCAATQARPAPPRARRQRARQTGGINNTNSMSMECAYINCLEQCDVTTALPGDTCRHIVESARELVSTRACSITAWTSVLFEDTSKAQLAYLIGAYVR